MHQVSNFHMFSLLASSKSYISIYFFSSSGVRSSSMFLCVSSISFYFSFSPLFNNYDLSLSLSNEHTFFQSLCPSSLLMFVRPCSFVFLEKFYSPSLSCFFFIFFFFNINFTIQFVYRIPTSIHVLFSVDCICFSSIFLYAPSVVLLSLPLHFF